MNVQGASYGGLQGGSCTIPTVKGGFWTCQVSLASGRRRRADEEAADILDAGRAKNQGDDKAGDRGAYAYSGLQKTCSLTCNYGWVLG